MMNKKITTVMMSATLLSATLLSACGTSDAKIATYAPAIDLYQYDMAKYNQDLAQCRELGQRVATQYREQHEKEKSNALGSAVLGAVAGAAVGAAFGDKGSDVASGAVVGGALGGGIGSSQVDYERTMSRFGPRAVVDRCLADRGYKILSNEGLGGG